MRGYPFMTFLIIADTVLQRATMRWKRSGDVVDVGGRAWSAESAPQSNDLADFEEMCWILAPFRSGIAS